MLPHRNENVEIDPAFEIRRLFSLGLLETEVLEKEDEIVIGGRSWNKNLRISVKKQCDQDGGCSSITLEMLLDVFKSMSSFPKSEHQSLIEFLGNSNDDCQHFPPGPGKRSIDDETGETLQPTSSKRRRKGSEINPAPKKKKINYFSQLPNEVVIRILSFLPTYPDLAVNVSQTCKRFRDLSTLSSLWTSMDLPKEYNESLISKLIDEHGATLRSISLGNGSKSADLAIKALRTCPALEELKGFENVYDLDLLADAITVCSSLRSLDIPNGSRFEVLANRISCLQNLTRIGVDYSIWDNVYQDGFLKSIGRYCKKLESFRYLNQDESRDSRPSLTFLHSEWKDLYFRGILYHARDSLKHLEFDAGCLSVRSFEFLGRCQLFETLVLCPALELEGRGLSSIVRLPNLKLLKLTQCEKLDHEHIIEALRNGLKMPTLLSLTLECADLRDNGLIAIVNACPNLKQLNLNYCGNISGVGIDWILRKCGKLEDLTVSIYVSPMAFLNCVAPLKKLELPGISEIEMQRIKFEVPSLKSINLLRFNWWR